MWVIWKEQNDIIFRGKQQSPEEVWKIITSNLMETVRGMQWSKEDKEFPGPKKRIAEAWGLDSGIINGLHQKPKSCRVESPNSWSPHPRLVFKVNFDGVARGNPGDASYGGVC